MVLCAHLQYMIIPIYNIVNMSLVLQTPFSPCRDQEKDLKFSSDWNISKTSELYSVYDDYFGGRAI